MKTAPNHDVASQPWPEGGLEQVGHCPACGETKRSLLHDGLWDNAFFVAPGRWTMWRCDRCRSGYLDPRPTPNTIGLAYGRYYTHAQPTSFTPPTTRLGRLRFALGNGYRNVRYGTSEPTAHPLGRILVTLYRPLARQNDFRFRFLDQPRRPGATRRVLDVGCGAGAFLLQAREAGWESFGVDFDPVAVEGARGLGLDVTLGGIEAIQNRPDFFDAVTMSHVIEHVHDPMETLRLVSRVLRPGGRLYVETPNIDALGHKIYGASWRGLEAPRHLAIYNRPGLSLALKKAGFVDVKFRRDGSALAGLNALSAKIAAGHDPYDDSVPPVKGPTRLQRLRSTVSRNATEFLAFTAEKPRQ